MNPPPRLQAKSLRFLDKGPYSFAVKAGECVGVAGPSGVGKSLLLKALTELIPYGGEIRLDGSLAASFSGPQWRRRVTMVAAEPTWWFDRVGDHFLFADDRDRLRSDLGRVDFAVDVLEWEVGRLSTGEKQRLAIVRQLAGRPLVLCLDEPTSALDRSRAAAVEELLGAYRDETGCAMLWVSHDPEQLGRVARRTLVMSATALDEEEKAR